MSMVDRCCSCDELVPRCRCPESALAKAVQYAQRFVDPADPPELRPENRGKWVDG